MDQSFRADNVHYSSLGMKKIYYNIGEVEKQLQLAQHVIRHWETVFPQLKPMKSRGNIRRFREKDIELLRTIKHLLYECGYTTEGAKRVLNHRETMTEKNKPDSLGSDLVNEIRQTLKEILDLLG